MNKIIGSGLISKAISRHVNNLNMESVFFASGVSNSLEENLNEFNREEKLLNKTIANNVATMFVYFSTCSVYEKCTPYTSHKIKMEELIKEKCDSYIIYRLPQVVGIGKNKHTLMNYLHKKIINEEKFDVINGAVRNIIDVDDVARIVIEISGKKLLHNKIVNIATPYMQSVESIIKAFEDFLNKKAIYNIKGFQKPHKITIETMLSVINIENYFSTNSDIYTKNIIKKYY